VTRLGAQRSMPSRAEVMERYEHQD